MKKNEAEIRFNKQEKWESKPRNDQPKQEHALPPHLPKIANPCHWGWGCSLYCSNPCSLWPFITLIKYFLVLSLNLSPILYSYGFLMVLLSFRSFINEPQEPQRSECLGMGEPVKLLCQCSCCLRRSCCLIYLVIDCKFSFEKTFL